MKINTVCGKISAEDLGKTLIHEHIICSSPEMMGYFFPAWNPPERVVPRAVAMLKFVKENFGINSIVDGTPLSLGRNMELLKEVSEKAQVHIISSSGFYIYDCFTARRVSPEKLAWYLIEEVEKSKTPPGFLKCAVEESMTACQQNFVEIVGRVHLATGLPIFAHSNAANKSGHAILDVLEGMNVPFSKVIIGHTGDSLALEYPLSLLERGANISIDRICGDGKKKGELAEKLIRMGYKDKLFLSHDAICYDDRNNFPDNGEYESYDVERLAVIHKYILPAWKAAGIPEGAVRAVFEENPRRLFM